MSDYVYLSMNERVAISSNAMREREDHGAEIGVSKLIMMENAGSGIARFVANKFGRESSKVQVVLVAGTGNNGGDVFVAARHLAYWRDHFEVSVALIGKQEDIRQGEASTNWKILQRIPGVGIALIDSSERIELFKKLIRNAGVIIVGIFGTGFRGKPRDFQSEVIQIINAEENATIVSVDVPSGMESDTGFFEVAVASDFTITMDSPKLGMVSNDAAKQMCGEIVVTNIGLP